MATILSPGMSANFSATFTPASGGSRRAALHIVSNVEGALNPFDIDLAGTRFDNTPPNTIITSGPPVRTNYQSASIAFSATDNVGASGFEGRLDNDTFSTVNSPVSLNNLTDGTHTYQVRARDAAGNQDPTPATVTWTVDTKPPTLPGNIATIDGASGGAVVTFAASDTGGTGIGQQLYSRQRKHLPHRHHYGERQRDGPCREHHHGEFHGGRRAVRAEQHRSP
jgi:hypothetical protein